MAQIRQFNILHFQKQKEYFYIAEIPFIADSIEEEIEVD